MADKSASLIINIIVNDAQAAKAVQQIREQVGGLPPAAEDAAEANGSLADSLREIAGAYGAWKAAVAAFDLYKEAETAAFNLSQSIKAANEQFQDVGSAESWKNTIAELSEELIVYSKTALTDAVSKTLDMTKRLGMSEEQMRRIITVAADLGAGKMELGDSIERITAALRGEAEASEALGLTLNEDYVTAWYNAAGATEGAWKDLNDAQKAQVRYNALLEQALPLAGKAAASYDTLAGSISAATAKFRNLVVDGVGPVGKIVGDVTQYLDKVAGGTIRWAVEAAEGNKELAIGIGVTGAAFAVATGFVTSYNSALGATVIAQATAAAGSVAAAAAIAAPYAVIAAGLTSVALLGVTAVETWEAQRAAAASARQEAEQWAKYYTRLDRASAAAGVELKSWQQVQAAYQSGILDYDKMTDTYSKGSGVARAAAEVHAEGAKAVGEAAKKSQKSIEELDKENKILFSDAKKNYEDYAKGIKEASGKITEIGLLPTDTKKALESLAATAQITGAAMTKAWTDPADAVASYVPRLLGVADAEEAAVRQSLVALSAKDKALEAQHRQTLLNGKLIIEQVGVQAEVSKIEQETIWDIEDAYRGKLDAIMEVKSANGALIPGMQMVAGVWTNIGVAADRSNKQQLDGLQGLRLGMSSLAGELYELSLVGKNQEQVWKANQIAAAQYLQSAKELGAQAKREALKGNDEGAKQLWDAEAAAIAKADALYRKLAVTVKTEWSPEMEAAHKQSTESITKYGGAASKALDLARSGYDKVADAAKRSADAQQYFGDKLRDVARESMTEAQAYDDIKRAAAEATAEAARLSKAGDWQGAQEQAKAAADAWAQVPKEVKDGEQTLVSSAESAQVRADGIRQAAEISKAAYAAERQELEANAAAAQRNAEIIIAAEQAIVAATAAKLAALKAGNATAAADEEIAAAQARAAAAQKQVEAAAQESGDSSGAQATQKEIDKINELVKANEAAAAAIKKQEEDKGKVISEESENAKIAAEGVVAAQQQLVDAYDEQRSTLEGLASTEVAIMESVAKATTSASAEIKAAVAAAKTELESIKASIDAIPSNKEVTITVREVQARFGGGPINMSGGARVSGPTGYDSVHALLAGNEYIINNKSTADIGFGHFHFENTRQWDKALKSLASFHGPAETARLLSGFLPQPEITMRPLPSFRQQEPSQSSDLMNKMKNFGTINLQIGDVAVPAMVQVDHLAIFQREQEKQRQRMQRATGRRP